MLDLTQCPDPACGSPAEIVDRYPLSSTAGPVEQVAVRCLHRHWFFMPTERLATPHPVADRRDVFRIG
jgi:hypothetical protein